MAAHVTVSQTKQRGRKKQCFMYSPSTHIKATPRCQSESKLCTGCSRPPCANGIPFLPICFLLAVCRQNRSSGGAGAAGSYRPPDPQLHNSSSVNPADPSDPRPHITRSSGGAAVEGTYGPDSTAKGSKESKEGSAQQHESKAPSRGPEQKPQAAAAPAEDSVMPDPLIAADVGSHNMQPRSKL